MQFFFLARLFPLSFKPLPPRLQIRSYIVPLFISFLFCLIAVNPAAASRDLRKLSVNYARLPLEYGEIIYSINEKSPKQVYIVGISHRDAESGMDNDDTVQVQAEIFRIGEWLNRNMELNLLLPEGYFSKTTSSASRARSVRVGGALSVSELDKVLLLKKLADNTRFVNAEMLLMKYFDMRASQVESREIYNAVRHSLAKLKAYGADRLTPTDGLAELRYLQEIRTAMLMQEIPGAIEGEFCKGTISKRFAMLTIGLNHLADIMRYIMEDSIRINAPANSRKQMENYSSDLKLLKEGYGITIIIPRSLADNRELMQMAKLNSIILAEQRATVSH